MSNLLTLEVSAAAAPPLYPLPLHCYQNQKMVEQNTQSSQSIEVSQCIQVFAHCPLVLSSSVVLIWVQSPVLSLRLCNATSGNCMVQQFDEHETGGDRVWVSMHMVVSLYLSDPHMYDRQL